MRHHDAIRYRSRLDHKRGDDPTSPLTDARLTHSRESPRSGRRAFHTNPNRTIQQFPNTRLRNSSARADMARAEGKAPQVECSGGASLSGASSSLRRPVAAATTATATTTTPSSYNHGHPALQELRHAGDPCRPRARSCHGRRHDSHQSRQHLLSEVAWRAHGTMLALLLIYLSLAHSHSSVGLRVCSHR